MKTIEDSSDNTGSIERDSSNATRKILIARLKKLQKNQSSIIQWAKVSGMKNLCGSSNIFVAQSLQKLLQEKKIIVTLLTRNSINKQKEDYFF